MCTVNIKYSQYVSETIIHILYLQVSTYETVPCDPDKMEDADEQLAAIEYCRQSIKEYMPFVEPEPAIVENCLYTVSEVRG